MNLDRSTLNIALLILAVVLMWRHYYKLASRAVRDWATSQNFLLLECIRCQWKLGPYMWKSYRGQEVFRIYVKDKNGNKKRGWVRINVPWYGGIYNLSGKGPVDVTWEQGQGPC